MLSRVANALYWMSRYVERAENITRILTVNFHTLLDAEFPRAVRFCLQRALRSAAQISGEPKRQAKTLNGPQRVIGRICAELDYLDIKEILGQRLNAYLDQLLLCINQVGDEITRTYFNTQVILPSKYGQSAQQQQ